MANRASPTGETGPRRFLTNKASGLLTGKITREGGRAHSDLGPRKLIDNPACFTMDSDVRRRYICHGHLRAAAEYDTSNRLTKAVYLIPFGGSGILQRTFVFPEGALPVLRFESVGADGKNQINEAFVLEYRLKPGDGCHYATTINFGPGQEKKMRMSQRCTGVNPDGTIEVTVETDDPPAEITMTMARSGHVLRTSLGEPPQQPRFPTHPVFINETWSQEMPFPLVNPFTNQSWKPPLTYNYILAGVEQQEGRRVARIRMEVAATVVGIGSEAAITIETKGETVFDIENGLQLSSDVSSYVRYAVFSEVSESRMSVSVRWEP